jgi:prepilin-type N-terminal cleavage/methylation domain-containing protein
MNPGRRFTPPENSRRVRAFTLIEVVLAVAVFTIAAIAGLAMFGSLVKNAGYVRNRDNAIRLNGALEDVIKNEDLDQILQWYKNQGNVRVYAYTYLASALDGKPVTPSSDSWSAGSSSVYLMPSVRDSQDTELNTELAAKYGPLFRIKFKISSANPVGQDVIDALDPNNLAAYNEATLVVFVQFYQVPANNAAFPAVSDLPTHVCTLTYVTRQ